MSQGKLIISLDFELMWGFRDHRSQAEYGDAILGGRAAIPDILAMFQAYGIRATWATVGLLFARSRQEMLEYLPDLQPDYADRSLSPYTSVAEEIGESEEADPLHFGRSLVDRIADTEGQEIATHTFSHFYCLEKGQSLQSFAADISAAKAIAASAGHDVRSIVFPRNQMTDAHLSVCANHGIDVFRGNPGGFANSPRSRSQTTPVVRGARLLDSMVPIFGRTAVEVPTYRQGCVDVKASRFLRPWSSKMPQISKQQHRHVIAEMRHAAQSGRHYHLWWHPHNMGRNIAENLGRLDALLKVFQRLQSDFGMESANMLDVANSGCASEPT